MTDSSGRSALHWAAHHGYAGCAKILMRAGGGQGWAVPDQGGVTVLHLAMRHHKVRRLYLELFSSYVFFFSLFSNTF